MPEKCVYETAANQRNDLHRQKKSDRVELQLKEPRSIWKKTAAPTAVFLFLG